MPFVPAHAAEQVVQTGETVALRDDSGHPRFKEGKYTPGQIDTRRIKEIEDNFTRRLDQNPDKLRMSRAEAYRLLKTRTW